MTDERGRLAKAAAPAPARAARAYEPFEDRERIVALLGASTRAGPWVPPERLTAVAALGSVVLDFRKAELPPGETIVRAVGLLGSVEILVPAELDVEAGGFSFLGSVEHRSGGGVRRFVDGLLGRSRPQDGPPDDEAPFLSVRSTAILGSVVVKVC